MAKDRVEVTAETATGHAVLPFRFRMKESLKAALEASARHHGTSLNTEIHNRLEASLRDEDRFGGQAMLALANMLTGAYLRGGQLGAAAVGHPEWTPEQWMNDATCHRAAAYAVAQALGLPLPTEAKMSDPAAVHELLTGMVARGVPLAVNKEPKR